MEETEDREESPARSAAMALAEMVPRLARTIASALESDPDVSLSLRQYRMLQRLAERPHRTSELASTSGVSQPTASATVASLEARGLVDRQTDPNDRRASLLELTDDGRAMMRRATECMLQRLMRVTEGMSEADAEALGRLQSTLTRGMDRVREQRRVEREQG